jgi:hypothetical protein
MKKGLLLVLAIVLLLGVIWAPAPKTVLARPLDPQPAAGIAEGAWSTGTEVSIDLTSTPAPYDWLQLLTKGVKVTEPGQICHSFRGAQFKWVGTIYQLVDGKWVKLETTASRGTNEENGYSACAVAPSAGTYTLFGYYTGPAEAQKTIGECSTLTFYDKRLGYIEEGNDYYQIFARAPMNVGETITVEIVSTDPAEALAALNTSSFNTTAVSTGVDGLLFFQDFSSAELLNSITIRLYTSTCYEQYTLEPTYGFVSSLPE